MPLSKSIYMLHEARVLLLPDAAVKKAILVEPDNLAICLMILKFENLSSSLNFKRKLIN